MARKLSVLLPSIQTSHLFTSHIAEWNMYVSHMAVIRSSLLKVTTKSQVTSMNFHAQCAQIIGQASLRKDEAELITLYLQFSS